jgi:tRNA A37 methylthiotransferase MiaB
VEDFADLAEELMAQRAADRLGDTVDVLIEEEAEPGEQAGDRGLPGFIGRAAHQAPEVDGVTFIRTAVALAAGDIVRAAVTGSDGVDLTADVIQPSLR